MQKSTLYIWNLTSLNIDELSPWSDDVQIPGFHNIIIINSDSRHYPHQWRCSPRFSTDPVITYDLVYIIRSYEYHVKHIDVFCMICDRWPYIIVTIWIRNERLATKCVRVRLGSAHCCSRMVRREKLRARRHAHISVKEETHNGRVTFFFFFSVCKFSRCYVFSMFISYVVAAG